MALEERRFGGPIAGANALGLRIVQCLRGSPPLASELRFRFSFALLLIALITGCTAAAQHIDAYELLNDALSRHEISSGARKDVSEYVCDRVTPSTLSNAASLHSNMKHYIQKVPSIVFDVGDQIWSINEPTIFGSRHIEVVIKTDGRCTAFIFLSTL